MNRLNALVIALFLGVAGVTGAMAITKTVHLGAASAAPEKADRSAVRARAKRLDAWAKALRSSLAKRPPALPPVPRYAPVSIPTYVPPATPVAAPAAARPIRTTAARRVAANQVETARPTRGITQTTRKRDDEQPKPEPPAATTTTQATTTEPAPPVAPQPQPTTEPSGGGGDDRGGGGSDDPPGDR